MKDTLLELAGRVEAAVGGDGRLNAEIDCAVRFRDLRPAEPTDFNGEFGYQPGKLKVEHGFLMAESYTHSLDAALTLVPEGGFWTVGNDGDGPDPSLYAACVLSFSNEEPRQGNGTALTAPLALCAAALRARAATTQPHDALSRMGGEGDGT